MNAAVEGFNRANSLETKVDPPSDEEFDAMLERHLH
jgi:hypothetical protein